MTRPQHGVKTLGHVTTASNDISLLFYEEVLERAEGIEPSSSVWKTEVLTITQRPRNGFSPMTVQMFRQEQSRRETRSNVMIWSGPVSPAANFSAGCTLAGLKDCPSGSKFRVIGFFRAAILFKRQYLFIWRTHGIVPAAHAFGLR